mgnify:CR=1 FL=1
MFVSDLLAGKRILITGGGTGLGKVMAGRFLSLGAEVIICGRRAEVLEKARDELGAEYGPRIRHHSVDIRDYDAIETMLDALWADGAAPNVLVNNAAGNFVARTETLSHRAFDAIFNIVAHGTANMTLALGKRWIADDMKATVLSILVTTAWTGAPYNVPSAMAKAGVLAMTRSLAVEWGPKGIRFVAVAPGPFPTKGAWDRLYPRPGMAEMMEKRPPLGRVGRHDEFGNLTAYLLSDQAEYIHGDCITIDGGNWLRKASSFQEMEVLSDAEWEAMAPKKG